MKDRSSRHAGPRPLRFVLAVLFLGWLPYAGLVGVLRDLLEGWPRSHAWILSDLMPVLAAVAALLWAARPRGSRGWTGSFEALGLGRLTGRHIWVGLAAGLPAVAALAIMLARPGADRSLGSFAALTAIRVILAQALFEELLFRGFLFRRLLTGMGFKRAALWAALAFGLCHFGNLVGLHAPPAGKVAETGIQVVMTGILAIAPLYLVRRSGGSLWPACLWHLMIDISILFPGAAPDAASALPLLAGSLLTIPAAVIAGRLGYGAARKSPPGRDLGG